jgi:SAM-dependent methyltransferase
MEMAEYRRMAENEETHWWYAATRALLRQLLEPTLASGGTLLDVGAGTGATGAWLAEFGTLVAVDFEHEALAMAAQRHPTQLPVAADACALPIADASVDAVLCVTVLCHQSIESPTAAVREFARVVRPGGIVCLWEPGVRRLRRAHDRVTHTGRRFSRLDLSRCASDAGLEVLRSTGAHSYLIPPAFVKSLLERGEVASDLDGHAGGLGGVLATAARGERALLRRIDLPFGLSAITVARRPLD